MNKVFEEALRNLECLYDDAKIEADWIKDRVITYAEEHEHNDRIKPYYEHIKQALTTKSKKEQAFDVMKKYAVNDGWSNGWVIKFWDMDEEELELVNEVLKND